MEGNSLVSFENLCKIFEMRIKLDKETGVKTSLEVLDNYEKYAKKIDSVYNSQFQKELKPLISPAVTLEKEKDRLRRLIKLLEDRLDKRAELEDRYYNTTGKYLSGFQMIVSDDELEEKRERLSLITKYLETSEEIKNVNDSLVKLRDLLIEEEQKKEEYERKNKIMEDELYSSFMSVIKNNEYFKGINEEDIDTELDSIRGSVIETKETLDITKESIGSLVTSGLDEDYASYVEEAEKNYFNYKNRELVLKIYKLVVVFEDDFKLLCSKREKINEYLIEKKELSDGLTTEFENELLSFEKVLLSQCDTLDNEKEVIDNIANYTSRIKFKEERLEELNECNDSVDVLSILREYGLIETYDTDDALEDVSLEEYESIDNDVLTNVDMPLTMEDIVVEKVYDPYRIVEITDYPKTLNVGLAKLKGESVREKVNKKLNPKMETTFDDIVSVEENVEPVLEETKEENVVVSPEESLGWVPITKEEANEELKLDAEVKVEIPVIEEPRIETPVWELPIELEPKPVFEQQSTNALPVWDVVPEDVVVAPLSEVNNISDKPVEPISNFWIPVSESKVESSDFPQITLPINNNMNSNSEFVFPTINN